MAEQELRRVTDEYRRLREELLPIFRMAKDRSQPLPFHPTGPGSEVHGHDQLGPMHSLQPDKQPSDLGRKYSKRFVLGATPKNASPTYIPPSIQENKAYQDRGGVDPSAAAMAASNHLNASMTGGGLGSGGSGGGSQPSTSPGQPPNMPSPTSPPSYKDGVSQSPIMPRSNNPLQQPPPPPPPPPLSSSRERFAPQNDDPLLPAGAYSHPAPNPHNYPPQNSHMARGRGDAPSGSNDGGGAGGSGSAPSVEIFKSFRVAMEDPCYKVLPAALERYKINADWRQYALYIVHGDEERCLALDEKPLILFKQLDREGRKPMFMLRKMAASSDGLGVGGSGVGGVPGGSGQPGMNGVGPGGNQPGSAGLPRDPSAHDPNHPGSAGNPGVPGSGPGGAAGGMQRGLAYQSGVTLPGGVL